MTLPHNAYLTALSPEDAIVSALGNRAVEVDLAVSHFFFDVEGDFSETEPPYLEYFEKTVNEITYMLGKPITVVDGMLQKQKSGFPHSVCMLMWLNLSSGEKTR